MSVNGVDVSSLRPASRRLVERLIAAGGRLLVRQHHPGDAAVGHVPVHLLRTLRDKGVVRLRKRAPKEFEVELAGEVRP